MAISFVVFSVVHRTHRLGVNEKVVRSGIEPLAISYQDIVLTVTLADQKSRASDSNREPCRPKRHVLPDAPAHERDRFGNRTQLDSFAENHLAGWISGQTSPTGVEPVVQPSQGRRLIPNRRQVPGHGVEPRLTGSKPVVHPSHSPGKLTSAEPRIELGGQAYETRRRTSALDKITRPRFERGLAI